MRGYQFVVICKDGVEEFFVGPFRTFERAEKAARRMEAAGPDCRICDLESYSEQQKWLGEAESDLLGGM